MTMDVGPTTWLAGWNMPGHLPDTEPFRTMDWEEARDALHDELHEAIDSREQREGNFTASDLRAAGESLLCAAPNASWSAEAHGVAYWIAQEEG
jgi:hypothetical protein